MLDNWLKITILGCGTSVGVPCLGHNGWGRCNPNEPKNRRQRCALLVQTAQTTILVDAGPDIRHQLLPHNLLKLDALLITHTHSDHVAGLDELRAYYWPDEKQLPVFATDIHGQDIKTRMPYMFERIDTSPSYFIPPLKLHVIDADQDFMVGDIHVQTLYQDHGRHFSLGFIFDDVCGYSTDVNAMPDRNFEKLSNIPLWIVESLRAKVHQSHAHFELTFQWIARAQPQRAVLTHLGLESDYDEVLAICPQNTEPGYDGMNFVFERHL